MAFMTIDYACNNFDCSCGEEDQPLPDVSFWDMSEEVIRCKKCDAVFELSLEGGTEEGFRWEGTSQ